MSRTVKTIIVVVLVAVLGIGIYFLISSQIKNSKYRPFDHSNDETPSFIELLRPMEGETSEIPEEEQIVRVYYDGYVWQGYTAKDGNGNNYSYWTVGPNPYTIQDQTEKYSVGWIAEHGIQIDYGDPNAGSGWGNVIYIAVLVIGLVAFFMIFRATSGGGGKVMNFGKTKARVSTNLKVRFSDVAGKRGARRGGRIPQKS